MPRSRSVLVIGVGNAVRGDDAAGLEVARRLADLDRESGIEVRAHEGDGVGLLELWDGAEAIVLVDSACSGAVPGTIHRIDASSARVPVPLRPASTHALGVAEAIELARAMETLPSTVIVYGLEGSLYETGSSLSEHVAPAIDLAADAVRREALGLLSGHSASRSRSRGSRSALCSARGSGRTAADQRE
jgi:hydrogenase maturation protease